MNHRATGTTQTKRITQTSKIRDTSIVDSSRTNFLNFIHDFSGILHYWNGQGNIQGNWRPFFQSDISFVLADISRYDIDTLRKKSHLLKKRFFATHNRNLQEQYIISLYQNLLQSGITLGQWYQKITNANNADQSISDAFLEITQANLDSSVINLVSIFDNLSDSLNTNPNIIAQYNIAYESRKAYSLLKILIPNNQHHQTYPGNGLPISLLSFWQFYDQIFTSILTTITQILKSIPSFIDNTLSTPNHSPQITLILAFYDMLGPARDQLNSLADRHHQFYFQDILKQKPQSYTPDQTFITFQSTKNAADIFLPKGTELLAGTSTKGTPIIYQIEQDLTVNHTTPTSYKTIYNSTSNSNLKLAVKGAIQAAPVANSADGQGSKIKTTPASWSTFGQSGPKIQNNSATLGFAVSSPTLFYSDGNRRIRFNVLTAPEEIYTLANTIKKLQWPELCPIQPISENANQKQTNQKVLSLQKITSNQESNLEKSIPPKNISVNSIPQQISSKAPKSFTSWISTIVSPKKQKTFVAKSSINAQPNDLAATSSTEQKLTPSEQTFKQAQEELKKAATTINKIEIEFRNELQSCASTIAQISNRAPVPLTEWLDAAVQFTEFKTKYHLVSQYHYTQVNHSLKNSYLSDPDKASSINSVLPHPKELEVSLATTLKHKKTKINQLAKTLKKKGQGFLSKTFDTKSTVLEKNILKMLTSSSTKSLSHSSQVIKSLKSVSSTIHPDVKIAQNKESNKTLDEITNNNNISNISDIFTSTLEQSHTTISSIVSIKPLLQIEKTIQKIENQLIDITKKSFLIIPSPDINYKFTQLEKQSSVAAQTINSSKEAKTKLLNFLNSQSADESLSKAKSSNSEDPETNTEVALKHSIKSFDFAHQGLEYINHLWHNVDETLSNRTSELVDTVDYLRNHKINDLTNDVIGLIRKYFPNPEINATNRQKKNIDQTKKRIGSLHQKIQSTTQTAQQQVKQTKILTNKISQQFHQDKQSLSDAAHKAAQLLHLKNTITQHIPSLHKELTKNTATSSTSANRKQGGLKESTNLLKQRLQCWKPVPARPQVTLEKYLKLNQQLEPILQALLRLLLDISHTATLEQKSQIQQITQEIQILQQKIQTINNRLNQLSQNTLKTSIEPVTYMPNQQAFNLLANQLLELPNQNNTTVNAELTLLIQSLENIFSNFTKHTQTSTTQSNFSNSTHQRPPIPRSSLHNLNQYFDSILNFTEKLLTHLSPEAAHQQKIEISQIKGRITTLQNRIKRLNNQTANKLTSGSGLVANLEKISSVQDLKQTVEETVTPLLKSSDLNIPPKILTETLDNIKTILQKFQPLDIPTTKISNKSSPLASNVITNIQPSDYSAINVKFDELLNFLLKLLDRFKKTANSQQLKQINQLILHMQTLKKKIQEVGKTIKKIPTAQPNTGDQPAQSLQTIIIEYITEASKKTNEPANKKTPDLEKFHKVFSKWHDQFPFSFSTAPNASEDKLPEEPDWNSIATILQDAFLIDYSASKGWQTPSTISINPLYIIPKAGSDSLAPIQTGFQINMTLAANAQAPAAWTEKSCGGSYQPNQPVVRATLNQDKTIRFKNKQTQKINPYPLLAPLKFQELLMWGDVNESNNFSAQNQFSTLKPTKPFALFGEQPIQGAEFYLGNTESLRKKLNYFIGDITWYDLPQSDVGFAQMYDLYNRFGKIGSCFTNGAFQWSVDILRQQKWHPLKVIKLQPFEKQATSFGSDQKRQIPIFEWNPLSFIELIPDAQSYVDFKPQTATTSHQPLTDNKNNPSQTTVLPPIAKPTLPPLPQMSPLNVGPLIPNTLLIFDSNDIASQLSLSSPTSFSSKTQWNKGSQDGFLRFTLTQPFTAFGSQDYADIMAAVANANVTRMANFVTFRTLKPSEQEALINSWTKSTSTTSSPKDTTSNTSSNNKKSHSTLHNIVGDLGKVIKGITVVGINLVEKAAQVSPNPLVRLAAKAAGSATEILNSDKAGTAKTTVSPSKLFAPIKPPPAAWIPKVKNISMSYGNYEKLTVKSDTSSDIQFYQIHPFGSSQPLKQEVSGDSTQLIPVYDAEGYLFIGLENVTPPETVTLLFTLDETTGDRRVAIPQPAWSFLNSQGWQEIPNTQLSDGTGGFIRSGVVSLTLLEQGNTTSDLFITSPSLYWLRIAVPSNVQATCQTISVISQAATAIYKSGAEISTHFNSPLPADTITKVVTPVPGLLKINQPVSSFGGVPPENIAQFNARVAERLRHKDRAITSWDYENLILQKFSQIRACLTLNHTSIKYGTLPGSVTTLIFPEITPSIAPLSPVADRSTLVDITNYLSSRCDPSLKISIVSPDYLYIKITAEIILQLGKDPGHYLQVLDQSLTQELAPWSIPNSTINPFEQSHTYDSILQFILNQTYIDTVEYLQITVVPTQDLTSKGTIVPEGSDPISTPNAWTILSSVNHHTLKISTGKTTPKSAKRINKISKQKNKIQKISSVSIGGNTFFLGGND